jgi:hypothetical protein
MKEEYLRAPRAWLAGAPADLIAALGPLVQEE